MSKDNDNIRSTVLDADSSLETSRDDRIDDHPENHEDSDHAARGIDDDELQGSEGHDDLSGGRGSDSIYGGDGDDRILGHDEIGDDDYFGGTGRDTVDYSGATAGVVVNLLKGTASGDDIGNDSLHEIEDVIGGDADDYLVGSMGDNHFEGGRGDDSFDGQDGDDAVVYRTSLSNFTLSRNGNSYTLRDKSGIEGTDQLTNVEHIEFADRTVNLTVQAKASSIEHGDLTDLEELYLAFYNRVPEADGLAYWIDQIAAGKSIDQIAESFYEAGVQNSSLTGMSAGMADADFVNLVYKNVLGRSEGADAEGLGYWSGELASGRASHGSLVSSILDSAHSYKGHAEWGHVANLLDNKIEVAHTYAVDLGLGYLSTNEAITQGIAIAAAVTSDSIAEAVRLIGVSAAEISLG